MGRNRALGTPYQTETVVSDFTTGHAVDAYMVDAVPLVVTLDPFAVNGDQVLIQDVTDSAETNPIVINTSEGQTILNGYGESISISTDGGLVLLTMTPDGWVPQFGSSRGGSGNISVVAPAYWIDSLHGSDRNNGTNLTTPFKTWAKLLATFGTLTTLTADVGPGNAIAVTLLNDLPANDPITFNNALGNNLNDPTHIGIGIYIVGQTVVLTSGVLTSAVAEDPTTNQPNTVELAGFSWTPYLNQIIVVDEGGGTFVRATILADLGSGSAQVSEWLTSSAGGGPLEYEGIIVASAPSAGNSFQIVDYTHASIAAEITTYNGASFYDFNTPMQNLAGVMVLQRIHFALPPGQTQGNTTFNGSQAIDSFIPSFIMNDCIFDYSVFIGGNSEIQCASMTWTDLVLVNAAAEFKEGPGGAHAPNQYSGYPGGIDAIGTVFLGGNVTFYGSLVTGAVCDIQFQGNSYNGSISCWNSIHPFFPNLPGTRLAFDQAGGAILGEMGGVPVWGSGNLDYIFFFPGTALAFIQYSPAGGPTVLPTLEGAGGPGGPALFLGPEFSPTGTEGSCWKPATGLYGGLLQTTWAQLDSGFVSETAFEFGATVTTSSGCRPDNGAFVQWQNFSY